MDKKRTMNWIIAIIVAIGYLTISILFDAWTYSWLIWVIYAVYRSVSKQIKLTPTLILNLVLLIVPPVVLVLVFRQWLARHIRWTVALTALCDVLLFWDELFYYESFGLFAVLILVQLAATGAAAFNIYNKQRKD